VSDAAHFESSLADGMVYCGPVESVRQKYYVFEAPEFFLIFSFSPTKLDSGNFNIVSKKAVNYVHKRFAGDSYVTSNIVFEGARRTKHVPNKLNALNILYILVAQENASIEDIEEYSRLVFEIYPR